ncbi:MAG: VOC family protein [Bryobacteraceae bacterium]
MSNVSGFHHITLCAATAQEDIDFFTHVVGQRMIKQTVLFDGRYAHYHLYYSNANAEPGSVMTTFPYQRVPGRPGSGQVSSSAYTIPKGSVGFWKEHLDRHKTPHTGIQERFGQKYIRFSHPSGLQFEAVETEGDTRVGWNTDQIKADTAMQGFSGTVLSVREIDETVRFFSDALGFKVTGKEGNLTRLELGAGGPNRTVILQHDKDRPSGSWTFGAGTAHHMALDAGTDEGLQKQKELYEELGYTDCSEIKDRNYFHSIYCRCPGGILVECAATAVGGFARDEPADRLGFELLLPPWFEEKRKEIEAMLDPITVPESNRAEGHAEAMLKDVNKAAVASADKAAAGKLSHRATGNEFVGGDK